MEEYKHDIKLLMTADTVGGVWTYCMELCRSLPDNIEIHLVTMGDRLKPWQQEEVEWISKVTVYETDYKLEWMQNPFEDIKKCGAWLLELEDEIQPHLVHLNCYAYGALPFKAPVIVVAHSDVYSWFLAVKKEAPSAEWNQYFSLVKAGLANADFIVAPSAAMMTCIQDIYTPKGEQRVIYNGRDPSLFYADNKEIYLFSMGRIWDEAKNVKLLVDAAPFINAPIKIAGDNSFDENSFEHRHSNVAFLGKLSSEQIAMQLSTASIFVLPAAYEPFGLSALEAALSGCVLVLGNIGSLKEIWGDAALYVDTDDAKAVADIVNTLLNDEALLEEYSYRAINQARKYSAQHMSDQYLQLYQQLMLDETKMIKKEIA